MTTSPFLTLSGAVPAEALDLGVAGHYGNPIVEQRKLERGDAIVDLSDRGLVVVTGPDRRSWLHSMASQAVDRLAPGESAEALLLDASGHIEHAVHLIDDGESTWLIVEGDEAAPLAAFLDRMRFMLRVEVADRSAEFAVIAAMSLDAQHEPHASEERGQRCGLVALDDEPARLAVVDHVHGVLDVTRRVEQQRLGTLARLEAIDGLAGHRAVSYTHLTLPTKA